MRSGLDAAQVGCWESGDGVAGVAVGKGLDLRRCNDLVFGTGEEEHRSSTRCGTLGFGRPLRTKHLNGSSSERVRDCWASRDPGNERWSGEVPAEEEISQHGVEVVPWTAVADDAVDRSVRVTKTIEGRER